MVLDKKLDGMVCTLPAATRNMFVDGEFAIPPNGSPVVYSPVGFVKVKSQHIIDTTSTLLVIPSSGLVGNVCCKTRGLS